MIPKKIHYVWIGNEELPVIVREYIDGWRRLHPRWEIRRWGIDDLKDVDVRFVREALAAKKWAFVSDYLRLVALYREGGFYLDTDVEVKKGLDELCNSEFVIGLEPSGYPQTAVIGCVAGHEIVKDILSEYEKRPFLLADGVYDQTPNPVVFMKVFKNKGLALPEISVKTMTEVAPKVFVCPPAFLCEPQAGMEKENITHHHMSGSWLTPYFRKSVVNFPFGFRMVRMKRRKFARKTDGLDLMKHEKLCFSISFGHRVYVLARVNTNKER